MLLRRTSGKINNPARFVVAFLAICFGFIVLAFFPSLWSSKSKPTDKSTKVGFQPSAQADYTASSGGGGNATPEGGAGGGGCEGEACGV
jgi:hypothetical protein